MTSLDKYQRQERNPSKVDDSAASPALNPAMSDIAKVLEGYFYLPGDSDD